MAGEASNSVKQAFLDGYMLQVNFPTNRVFMFTTARDTSEEAKLANARIRECANARMLECANGTTNQVPSFKGLSAVGIAKVDQVSTNALMNSRANELSNFRTLELPGRRSFSEGGSNFRTNVLSSSPSQNFRTLELSNFRTNSLILTTSASHLPRSMKIFQKQGLNPIAAPCDYTQLTNEKTQWFSYMLPFPSGNNFETAQGALYEWLGSLYESMTR
jgi:hypothetical protein